MILKLFGNSYHNYRSLELIGLLSDLLGDGSSCCEGIDCDWHLVAEWDEMTSSETYKEAKLGNGDLKLLSNA